MIEVAAARPGIYAVVNGETVELELNRPTKLSEHEAKALIARGIVHAVVEQEPKKEKPAKK